MSSIPELEI